MFFKKNKPNNVNREMAAMQAAIREMNGLARESRKAARTSRQQMEAYRRLVASM